ncbi:MAG: diguanylate cyclase [Ruminococcus sp.]|nr:diguanylate cyclase [Ruminococcus sp.]
MREKNSVLLLEYLKGIMEDPQGKYLDVEELDEEYRDLGNQLKTLQGNLEHLIWQMEQVTAGDYSRQIDFPGKVSDAFNEMTKYLREKETQRKEEVSQRQHQMEMAESHNELLVELLSKRNEWLLVVDMETKEILYCNKGKLENVQDGSFCESCKSRLSFRPEILKWSGKEQYRVWELEDGRGTYYRITSFLAEWKGRHSCVHMVTDITDEKQAVSSLTSKAYHDPGTGIKNRLFFEEYMELILKEKKEATLCYLDLDGLKYVNDTYGHLEGDIYIQNFVELIRNNFRSGDTFARIGGDEFCVVLTGAYTNLMEKKLKEILDDFQNGDLAEYRCSFSYGIVEIKGSHNEMTYDEILKKADEIMYECKRRNKEKYPELIR